MMKLTDFFIEPEAIELPWPIEQAISRVVVTQRETGFVVIGLGRPFLWGRNPAPRRAMLASRYPELNSEQLELAEALLSRAVRDAIRQYRRHKRGIDWRTSHGSGNQWNRLPWRE